MSAKALFVLCAQALFVQCVFSQCTSRAGIEAYAAPYTWTGPGKICDGFGTYDGLAAPAKAYEGSGWVGRGLACDGIYPAIAPALDFTPTSGGGLFVTSSSAVPPTGISVASENAYEGALAVTGEIPFVGSTAVEGLLTTGGAGNINHACGNGVNAMTSEATGFATGYAPSAGFAPASFASNSFAPNAFAPSSFAPNAFAPGSGAYAPRSFAESYDIGRCGCGSEIMY